MLAMLLGAYGKQDEAQISITEGNVINQLSLPSRTVTSREVPELVAHPDQHLKFKIPSLGEVRMINQQAWQTHSLKTWAGYGSLGSAFGSLLMKKLDKNWAETYIMSMVDALKAKTIEMPVMRYAKSGEAPSSRNL